MRVRGMNCIQICYRIMTEHSGWVGWCFLHELLGATDSMANVTGLESARGSCVL